MNELAQCFLRNASCALLNSFIPSEEAKLTTVTKFPNYAGGFMFSTPPTILPFFIKQIMGHYTASEKAGACKKYADCDTKNGFQCVKDVCIKSMTRYHAAYHTDFEYDYSRDRWSVVNTSSGAWAESR